MNRIRIDEKNASAIETALAKVNGKAEQHAFTTFNEINTIREDAETTLAGLLLKKDFPGTICILTSGYPVSNSYGNSRKATKVTIVRRTTGWFLTEVESVTINVYGGGRAKYWLTKEQDQAAVANVRKLYGIVTASSVQ
jgi:hypothetical protein